MIGIPLDENSSYLRGAAEAPTHIREALHCGSANYFTELGVDLGGESRWVDLGDLELSMGEVAFAEIDAGVSTALERGARVLSLGGDHSVTYPILRAFSRMHKGLTLLHFDAHPDIYDEFDGNRLSHASPFARIMEEGLVSRLVQVGIRTMSAPQREQVKRFGVEVVEMRNWHPTVDLRLEGPLYVSIDLDAFDPAFAPGVSHHEPGGLTTRDVLGVLHRIDGPIVGADVVEFNPKRDLNGATAMLAAKLARELTGRMLDREERGA